MISAACSFSTLTTGNATLLSSSPRPVSGMSGALSTWFAEGSGICFHYVKMLRSLPVSLRKDPAILARFVKYAVSELEWGSHAALVKVLKEFPVDLEGDLSPIAEAIAASKEPIDKAKVLGELPEALRNNPAIAALLIEPACSLMLTGHRPIDRERRPSEVLVARCCRRRGEAFP